MSAFSLRNAILAATMVVSASVGSGCYVDADVGPEYADGYQPAYFDGAVVYYDTVGRPYYYSNGAVYWVPYSHPYYGTLVRHYQAYGPAYHRWYGNGGYRYRSYRGGGGRRR